MLGVIRPTSLESAFTIDAPGEYEVHEVLVTGVRTFRDESKGAERGPNTAFVFELDGLHAIHLGDVGHVLTEQMLGEIGNVQVACIPVGGALTAARAAELAAGLDANLVIPMPVGDEDAARGRAGAIPQGDERHRPSAGGPAQRHHLDRPAGDDGGRPGAARPHLAVHTGRESQLQGHPW